jgi:hypothetical protein
MTNGFAYPTRLAAEPERWTAQGPARNAHRIAFAELEAGAKHVDARVVDDLEGARLTPCTGMLLGIDVEAFDGHVVGRWMWKVEPSPGLEWTLMVPPIRRMSSLEM